MVYNYSSSLHIYFLTSANKTGDSYGVYCDDEVMGVHIDTCLGDMFSVNWLEVAIKILIFLFYRILIKELYRR